MARGQGGGRMAQQHYKACERVKGVKMFVSIYSQSLWNNENVTYWYTRVRLLSVLIFGQNEDDCPTGSAL